MLKKVGDSIYVTIAKFIDSGEFAYNERILENIRYLIDREFRVE